ncbi:MAG: biotin--[acetyl-CoA-carboxylase] ligase [Gammaproteobacteria bacterium]
MVSIAPQPGFLESAVIRQHLTASINAQLKNLNVAEELPSTNQALLDAPIGPGELWVCLAEHQTAGRGRRGRRWVAPRRSGLCLSIGYGFVSAPAQLAALTLAIGVSAAGVLKQAGADEVQLKWPNDLTWRGRKLGGILTELKRDGQRPPTVVVGLGVNLAIPPEGLSLQVPQANPPVDLVTICDALPPASVLAAALVNAIGATLLHYADSGFSPFRADFAALDALNGQPVEVTVAEDTVRGVAQGITPEGLLKIRTETGDTTVMAGDVVMLRPAD